LDRLLDSLLFGEVKVITILKTNFIIVLLRYDETASIESVCHAAAAAAAATAGDDDDNDDYAEDGGCRQQCLPKL